MTTGVDLGADTAKAECGGKLEVTAARRRDEELAALMLAFQDGNEDAWEPLQRILFPFVWASFRFSHPGDDIEDLTQETLLRIWKARNFDPNQNRNCDHPFMAWVSTIARRLAQDVRERKARQREKDGALAAQQDRMSPLEPDEVVVAREERRELASLVAKCLEKLKVAHRQVLVLEMQGMGYRDIATTLGIKANTAGSRLNRAHTQFEASLREQGYALFSSGSPLPPGAVVLDRFRKGTLVRLPPHPPPPPREPS